MTSAAGGESPSGGRVGVVPGDRPLPSLALPTGHRLTGARGRKTLEALVSLALVSHSARGFLRAKERLAAAPA
jgi:hypothetical protein